jgi:hypothetical protein
VAYQEKTHRSFSRKRVKDRLNTAEARLFDLDGVIDINPVIKVWLYTLRTGIISKVCNLTFSGPFIGQKSLGYAKGAYKP